MESVYGYIGVVTTIADPKNVLLILTSTQSTQRVLNNLANRHKLFGPFMAENGGRAKFQVRQVDYKTWGSRKKLRQAAEDLRRKHNPRFNDRPLASTGLVDKFPSSMLKFNSTS